jgi:hypothetical protein
MTTAFASPPTTTAYIYDPLTGENSMWLTSDGIVYWYDAENDTKKKIGTATRDGKLLDLDGQFTGLYLKDLYGPAGNNDGAAFARLKNMARLSPAR